jgi:hypothetical protein
VKLTRGGFPRVKSSLQKLNVAFSRTKRGL